MKAMASLDGEYVAVSFEPLLTREDRAWARELAGMVPGGRRRGDGYRWLATVENCKRMRKQWGDALVVHRTLSEWYRLEARATAAQVALASAKDAVLGLVPERYPRLHAALGSWQKVGAAWLVNAYRNGALLVDEPGIGKTRTVIAGLLERGSERILVVCPKISVKMVWGNEFRKLAPDVPVYLARGTRAKRDKAIAAFEKEPSPQKVLVVVAEMLRIKGTRAKKSQPYDFQGYEYPQLFGEPWDAVVIDESHSMLGSLTIRKASLTGEGLRRLPTEAVRGLRLCVTGTPWGRGGRVTGMFGALNWCWPDEFTSYWRWVDEHFEVVEKYAGRERGYVKKITGLRSGTTETQFYASLGPRLLRRTMDEVVTRQHKPEYFELLCEMEGEQARQYAAMAKDAEAKVSGGVLTTTGTLDYLTRSRQMASGAVGLREDGKVFFLPGASNKLEVLTWALEERGILDGEGDLRVVVASQWTEYLAIVAKELDRLQVRYHLLTGSTSENQRDAVQERWQAPYDPVSNPERVFLLSTKAGGVSINLDSADEVHQLDRVYPPEAEEQLHRRIVRMSRDHPARIYFYHTEGTVDERIHDDLFETLMQQLKVLDARRGKEIARQVVRYTPPEEG